MQVVGTASAKVLWPGLAEYHQGNGKEVSVARQSQQRGVVGGEPRKPTASQAFAFPSGK